MRRRTSLAATVMLAVGALFGWLTASGQTEDALNTQDRGDPPKTADGGQLPKPDPAFKGRIGETYKDSTPELPATGQGAEGRPNVLLILLDDVGFGMCGTFGGPVPTPNMDKLADNGLKYTHFHTTALCSPTRAALLTGRNHHSSAPASSSNAAPDTPATRGSSPGQCPGVRDAPRQRVCHRHVRQGAQHARAGDQPGRTIRPLAHRPGVRLLLRLQSRRNEPVLPGALPEHDGRERPEDPRAGIPLHRGHDRRGHRLAHNTQAANPGKPWFLYYSAAGVHAPHHAPADWRARFAGKFDHGWDKQREMTSRSKRRSASSRPTRSSPRGRRNSRRGMTSQPTRRRSTFG